MNRNRTGGTDRAAQNAQTLKALVKLEGNKICADCKRNKHPRWASWNLGVFVCIRCSGIHRGMGTHISRVKSVDLDAWTDEQLQSVLKWGNTRANKYWEAKLQANHIPSDAKIENFIRTKYESRRWVMDGPMPDPSTLGDDDDVPLNVVQEKAKIERSASQRQAQSTSRTAAPAAVQAPQQQQPTMNLFDDFEPPPRPSTTDAPQIRPAQPAPVPAAPKPTPKPADSLMGLDFFGNAPPAGVGRPSSAAANSMAPTNTRGDLKNSILSLYASAPKPQAPAPVSHDRQPSFGGMASPPVQKQDAFGGLTDAFGGLNFSSNTTARSPPAQAAPSAFDFTSSTTVRSPARSGSQTSSSLAGLSFPSTVPTKSTPATAQMSSPPPLSGGNFFSPTTTKPPAPRPAAAPAPAPAPASNGLDFSFASRSPPAPKPATTGFNNDLFGDDGFNDFAAASPVATAPPPAAKPQSPLQSPANFNSVFNLSSTMAAPGPKSPTVARPAMTNQASTGLYNDPWGSADNNAWGAPESAPPKPAQPKVELGSVPSHITPNDISGGWGAPLSSASKPAAQQPTVTADEDFGGWTSASATQTPAAGKAPGGFGGPDPFDNPWG